MKLICIALLASLATAQSGPPPANVRLDEAVTEVVEQWREVTGEAVARRRAQLAAPEPGLVIDVRVDDGDVVRKGDVVALLDADLAERVVAQAEAELTLRQATRKEREALLDEASRELRRVETAASQGSSVERDLDAAQTALAAAQARLAQADADIAVADASLQAARKRLADMTILAPFDGVVIDRVADLGEWAAQGDTIVEMLDPASVEIRLDVPERFIARLDAGTDVRVRLLATGDELDASITHVIPDADVVSRLFPVRARVDTARVKPGMSIVGLVPSGRSEPSLTIHKDAIIRDDAGDKVYFDAGGVAAIARVSRLFAIGDRVAIRPGMVSPGMKLIVEGNERVFPGQPLQVIGGP